MSIQQLNDVYLKAGLKDKDGDLGTSGFLLSSTGTQTDWLDPNEVSVGSSENVEILVKNISSANGGVSLSKGDPIYIYGSVGASPKLYIDLADADSTATNNNGDGKMPCAGLLAQDLAPNGEGVAIVVGKLRNLITSPIDGATPTENDTLYVKSGGGLTLTKPTGVTNLIQNVGQVGRVDTASDGNIVVSAILRSNDVPNLPTGRIWVGDGNTTTSGVVYLDETNNRLGLNTTTPGYLLDVQQSGTQGYIRAWDGSDEFFKLQSDGDFKIGDIDFSNNGSYLELSNGDQFEFFIGSTKQFLVENGGADLEGRLLVKDQGVTTVHINPAGSSFLNGGNVGIGTTVPNEKLEVNGNTRITGSGLDVGYNNNGTNFIQIGNGRTTNGYAYIDLVGDSTYTDYGFRLIRNTTGANTSTQLIHRGTGALELISTQAGYITLKTNNAERVRVNSSGNVGIGTTSPEAILHINGTNDTTYWGPLIKSTSTNPARLTFTNTEGSGFIDQNDNALRFYHNSAYRMYIDSSGNVGIGTTTPSEKLNVSNGSACITPIAYAANQNDWVIKTGAYNNTGFDQGLKIKSTSGGTSYMAFETPGAIETMVLRSGNVGIGTDSPGRRLEISGGANAAAIRLRDTTSNVWDIQNSSLGKLDFIRGATNTYMRIDQVGKVGIGTTSPDSKLQISGSGTQRLRVTSTDGANADLSCDGVSSMTLGSPNGIPIRFVTSNQERARITSGGYVGIGTTTPNESLSVFKTSDCRISVDDGTQRWSLSAGQAGAGNFNIVQEGVTGNRLVILNNGNVGIGTTSPTFQLQLSTNSAAKPTSSAWTVVSDERVKTNIRPYETGLEELLQVKPKIFDYNGKAGFDTKAKNNIGVIAQEIKDVIPETVKKHNAKLNEEDTEDTELYNFDSHALTFALINSVKELNNKIEQLEIRIQTLENN